MTEEKAKASGRKLKVGKFPFIGNGKAIALGEPEGIVKTIFDADTGELAGCPHGGRGRSRADPGLLHRAAGRTHRGGADGNGVPAPDAVGDDARERAFGLWSATAHLSLRGRHGAGFVSHSTEDAAIARQVADALRAAGIGVWIAPDSIKPGEAYNEAIVAGLRSCETLVVLVSKASNVSKHVMREVGLADGQGKKIVPIRIEPVEPSDGLTYCLSLPQWVEWHRSGAAALAPVIGMLKGRRGARTREAAAFATRAAGSGRRRGAAYSPSAARSAAARNIAILVDGQKIGEIGNGASRRLQRRARQARYRCARRLREEQAVQRGRCCRPGAHARACRAGDGGHWRTAFGAAWAVELLHVEASRLRLP